jgi:hypothetical protein
MSCCLVYRHAYQGVDAATMRNCIAGANGPGLYRALTFAKHSHGAANAVTDEPARHLCFMGRWFFAAWGLPGSIAMTGPAAAVPA